MTRIDIAAFVAHDLLSAKTEIRSASGPRRALLAKKIEALRNAQPRWPSVAVARAELAEHAKIPMLADIVQSELRELDTL